MVKMFTLLASTIFNSRYFFVCLFVFLFVFFFASFFFFFFFLFFVG